MYGTILVVDDNAAILTAMKYLMADIFEEVLTTTQPDDILKLMAQQSIDMVLLDMNFSLGVNSGQEGLFWLRIIRKHHPDVPVVLLTAYADISLAVKGLKNGAADFITKPWDNDDLLRKMKDVLDSADEIATLDEMEKDYELVATYYNRYRHCGLRCMVLPSSTTAASARPSDAGGYAQS